uniref:Uncharacterized protein n=1 Tax=Panagrolaimus davidi TaxID=227884 RepID=A0A914Q8B2_9BILA
MNLLTQTADQSNDNQESSNCVGKGGFGKPGGFKQFNDNQGGSNRDGFNQSNTGDQPAGFGGGFGNQESSNYGGRGGFCDGINGTVRVIKLFFVFKLL